MNVIKYINLICIAFAIFTCGFIGYAYSAILDFFPWGNASGYVIFGLLIWYWIIPCCFFIGFIRLLLNRKVPIYLPKISFFLMGVFLYIPFSIGFDDATDLVGRWSGVISALVCIIILIIEFRYFIADKETDL